MAKPPSPAFTIAVQMDNIQSKWVEYKPHLQSVTRSYVPSATFLDNWHATFKAYEARHGALPGETFMHLRFLDNAERPWTPPADDVNNDPTWTFPVADYRNHQAVPLRAAQLAHRNWQRLKLPAPPLAFCQVFIASTSARPW